MWTQFIDGSVCCCIPISVEVPTSDRRFSTSVCPSVGSLYTVGNRLVSSLVEELWVVVAVDGVCQTDNHLDKMLTLGHLYASLHDSR